MNVRPDHDKHDALPDDGGFVSNYLLYLLAAASDAVSSEFHAQVREGGVRVPEWRVLACLNDRDGLMVTQLAMLALMEQSRLTKIVDQMAAKGMVTRRGDERDRRRVRVFLTDGGRRLARDLVKAAKAHEAGIIAQLDEGEIDVLKGALKRINALHGPARPVQASAAQAGVDAGEVKPRRAKAPRRPRAAKAS